jgi:MFS family permease
MVVMAVASTPLALVAGRLLQGILGGVVEAAAGFASTSGRGGARGATLGKSFSATAAGALLGPLAGGALVGTGNLRALMLVSALIAAALALASAVALTEPPRDRGHSTPDMLARDPAAGARRGRVLPLAAAAVAVYFGVYGLIPVYAQYTQSMVSSPASAGMWVGVAQSVTWAATLLASPWWGRRNDTTGGPLRNFVLAAAGCGLAIAAQALPIGLVAILGLRVVQGACFAALAQSLFFHASSTVHVDRAGSAVGRINSFLLAGQCAGPLMAGPLVSVFPVPVVVGLLGGACLLAAALGARSARGDTTASTHRDQPASQEAEPCTARLTAHPSTTQPLAPTAPAYRIGDFTRHRACPRRPPGASARSPASAGQDRCPPSDQTAGPLRRGLTRRSGSHHALHESQGSTHTPGARRFGDVL